jgi:UDP-N-acetylglucosamine 1-carboxyvinyltransferase
LEKIIIEGGQRLHGKIAASGAKNAALPILFATLLAPGTHRLSNMPELADVSSTLSLLGRMGCPSLGGSTTKIDTSRVVFNEAPYDVVRKMRASVLVLGPLLAREGEAHVSLPGGCAIGVRPIDEHLRGLEALGCEFDLSGGVIHGKTAGLRGAVIHMSSPSVTGTENILMAAVLAEGISVIHNAAREPEVVDLGNFLISLGANIEGLGSSTLTVHGVARLTPASRPYRILPDRIETGTYLAAAAITGGHVTITNTDPSLLTSVLETFTEMGCEITTTNDSITISSNEIKPVFVKTEPYPGFPTDMQAQILALCTLADGRSSIEETIFENRFMHVPELARMGAQIETSGRNATVQGAEKLEGASVMASDLRASAALVIAGLAAEGLTQVLRVYHLDRGYEHLVEKFRTLGANIARVDEEIYDEALLLDAIHGEHG